MRRLTPWLILPLLAVAMFARAANGSAPATSAATAWGAKWAKNYNAQLKALGIKAEILYVLCNAHAGIYYCATGMDGFLGWQCWDFALLPDGLSVTAPIRKGCPYWMTHPRKSTPVRSLPLA